LATTDPSKGEVVSKAIGTPYFRIYLSNDIIGAQIGGAVKNVLAIACGIVEGRSMGNNARAALITRGLAEIVRMGKALGAKPETLMGLSGLGDLTLTCSAIQSRNFSLGIALGKGRFLNEVLGERTSIAEGVFSASSVVDLAERLGVEIPICTSVDNILNQGADINQEVINLLKRSFKTETI
jgi:glycerol-3-phosphate dehydrogenase (NAD(P)+)